MAALKLCFPKSESSKPCITAIKICREFASIEINEDTNSKCTSAIPNRHPMLCMPKQIVSGTKAVLRTIARMRPDSGLYGESFTDHSLVDQWIDYMHDELNLPLDRILSSKPQSDDEKTAKAALAVIDKHLSANTYMVGNCITIADIYLVVGLSHLANAKHQECTKSFVNLNRLYDTCINQKQFKMCISAKPDDEDAPAPKKVNPLDSLPPSTMSLDEWKRTYSNTKDPYKVAMPWFWKNFDKSGYSLWYMKYDKTPDECKVDYLTSNLLGGFLQRIDPNFRKYSFAVNNVVEEKNCPEDKKSYDILGVWMMRGTEIPKEMTDHPSYEYHTFTKLDSEKTDDRKLIEDYWCADEVVEGRNIADCKVWK